MDKRIKFYSHTCNNNLLPLKPKSSFGHLKQGIQEFHGKYVLVPADKAANNIVVVCRLHYINTFKQELNCTVPRLTERLTVVNSYSTELFFFLSYRFNVNVKERQDKLPTIYWLPNKLHKRPYKARFIANSRSRTTIELSKLLFVYLTAVSPVPIGTTRPCIKR